MMRSSMTAGITMSGNFVMNIKNIYNPCDEDGHILINEMIANGDSGYITRIEKKDFLDRF